MKKYLSIIVLVGLLSASGTQAKTDVYQQERDLHEQTQLLREGKYGSAAKKGALAGAAMGGYLGYKSRPEAPEANLAGAAYGGQMAGELAEAGMERASHAGKTVGKTIGGAGKGAIIGAAVAVALKAGLRQWQLKKINGILQDRTDVSDFKALSHEQAMLIVAAYKRNVPMMKRLIMNMPAFVNQRGVWQALAELFYNKKPSSSRVNDLKEIIKLS